MSGADEFASDSMKSFDWSRLPPGEYEWKNGELIRVDDTKTDVDAAGDRFFEAMKKLVT